MLRNAVEKERKNVERGVGGRERKQVPSIGKCRGIILNESCAPVDRGLQVDVDVREVDGDDWLVNQWR